MGSLGKPWNVAKRAAFPSVSTPGGPDPARALDPRTFGRYDGRGRYTTQRAALFLLADSAMQASERPVAEVGGSQLVCSGFARRLRELVGDRAGELVNTLEHDAGEEPKSLGTHHAYLHRVAAAIERLADETPATVEHELLELAEQVSATADRGPTLEDPQEIGEALLRSLEAAPKPWADSPGAPNMGELLGELSDAGHGWRHDESIDRGAVARRWSEAITVLADIMQPASRG